jgi:hypothetical protein
MIFFIVFDFKLHLQNCSTPEWFISERTITMAKLHIFITYKY